MSPARQIPRLPSDADRSRLTGPPVEQLIDSNRRVRYAGLIFATIWAADLGSNVALAPTFQRLALPGTGGWPWPNSLFVAIALVGGLALAGASRWLADRPRLVLDLGLGYEVLAGLVIALLTYWDPVPHAARISWICPILVLYPAIAPSPPRHVLVASLLAASMDLLGFGLARYRGLAADWTAIEIGWMLTPNYLCAALAMVPTQLIRRLGRKVTEAAELGSYRLGRLIGEGGMGEVHEAEHRLIARPAAIKLIRPELLTSQPHLASTVIERFRREAEAVAGLRSPHTVELYDFGVAPDGALFYVMELLDGIDLGRLVETHGPVPPERAIHILQQACDSLAEAHEGGLIHRDIKPSNILVCRMGLTVDFVKILDFGLVRREVTGPGDRSITRSTLAPGTPGYMAPEIVRGEPGDRRADVYSLGCVAYWLVTGRHVFTGDSAVQIMYKHGYEDPLPPSRYRTEPLPADFEAVILQALTKEPEARIPSAGAFSAALDACQAPGRWAQTDALAWWNTHRPRPASRPQPGPAA
jgi:serine/threonine-protein kinase